MTSGRALLPLVARPKALALVGLGLAATLAPVAFLLALEDLDGTERAVTAILMAGAPMGLLGSACGLAVMQAARCTSSWTVPRFRQRLRLECAVGSLVLALVVSVATLFTVHPAPGSFPLVLASSLAAFAVGCAFTGLPESQLFGLLPLLLFALPWLRGLKAAVERPIAPAVVLSALAVLAMRATFSARTFRWAGLLETAPPAVTRATRWLEERRTRRQRTDASLTTHPAAEVTQARLPYADTLLRRIIAMSRATGPIAWLTLLGAGLLMGAVSAVVGTVLDDPPSNPIRVDYAVAGMLGFMYMWGPSHTRQTTLPWSRRDHFAATWSWHVAMALWYALVACPTYVAITWVLGSQAWTVIDAGRIFGLTLLLFPVGWWLSAGAVGDLQRRRVRLLLLVPVFQWGAIVLDALLSRLVPAPGLQLALLVILIAASQTAHWYTLRRHFTTRDLVGASD